MSISQRLSQTHLKSILSTNMLSLLISLERRKKV
jgi:hypothetical protein